MTFYRLQSKDYDINSESRSFWTCYDYIEEAMEENIKEWIIGFQPDVSWIDVDQWVIQNEEVKELYDNCSDISILWNKLVSDGYTPRRIHEGLSCYEENKKEKLKEYFEYNRPVQSSDMIDGYNDTHYILIFEGECVGIGLDYEDLAIFKKEIKRMSVKEFVESLE
ncbi:TPA: hypothetical protein ACXDAY_002281 [Clostridium botulinum]|uniref:hypothetical protein n=2 Tax=Clostridium botulinum TaxID=1491 RepID=UPI000463E6A5|nr:hypothetical protein [Clostridium botulinum]APR02542.1 hypothetical protein RSJ2_4190 [Clostridium botulinum]MBN3352016.1 hypothetical protein [Clostridium botulinum]MBN3359159.1 hypothetical protein [Clostridium botulinum]